ncbi:MAG: hypothetical protein AB7F86_04875 [Bdellovibrionales bacterium]
MGQCPICNGQVADDFGLVECPSCGAQLIVHVDGTIEHSASPVHNMDELASAPLTAQKDTSEPSDDEALFGEVEYQDPPAEDLTYQTKMATVDERPPDAAEEPPDLGPSQTMESATPDFLDAPADEPPPEVYGASPTPNPADLSDLSDFGNSEESGGREGSLRYNLTISGIDTSDIRHSFREAITDRKLMWDIDQIIRSIRNGEVQIANVSAVKAYLVVTRLRGLPVQVSWEQYAIHSA